MNDKAINSSDIFKKTDTQQVTFVYEVIGILLMTRVSFLNNGGVIPDDVSEAFSTLTSFNNLIKTIGNEVCEGDLDDPDLIVDVTTRLGSLKLLLPEIASHVITCNNWAKSLPGAIPSHL